MGRFPFRRWSVLLVTVLATLGVGLALLRLLSESRPPQAPAVRPVWTFEPPQRGAVVSSPLVAGKRVYVAVVQDLGPSSSGAVSALERATGRVVWRFDADGTMLQTYSSPCLDAGRLYLGEGMHGNHACKFYCLDAATGKELWHAETTDHIESSPCVADGKVFFAAGDDGVYGLDATTGKEAWHARLPVHIDSSPTLDGGRLYVGSGVTNARKTTAVYCLDAADGTERWHVGTDLPVWGSVAVADGRLFVPLGNGGLLQGPEAPERPAGGLLCLDAADGRRLWRYSAGDALLARPTPDGGRVVFGSRDGHCTCLDRDGGLCWTVDLGSPVVTHVASSDGRLYVVPLRGPVTCLDALTGTRLWAYDLAAATRTTPQLLSSPTAVAWDEGEPGGRRIFFGTELKNPVSSAAVVYCLED
jgi:outer membrane protein assembly factor BamB